MEEIEENFLPRDFQERLIKEKRFDKLVDYLNRKNIELDYKLIKYISPKEIGSLLAKISISKIKKLVLN